MGMYGDRDMGVYVCEGLGDKDTVREGMWREIRGYGCMSG